MTVNITDIDWDTGDFDEEVELATGVCVPDLPKNVYDVTLDIGDEDDWDEVIAEWLSDTYGYCVNGFNYEVA